MPVRQQAERSPDSLLAQNLNASTLLTNPDETMLKSFFPNPKQFFLSALAWFVVTLFAWYGFADDLGDKFSLIKIPPAELAEGERAPFLTAAKVWIYQYIVGAAVLFCIGWLVFGRNKWYIWSVVGTTIIMVVTYFLVQISVWINTWFGEFFDLIQRALAAPDSISLSEYYVQMATIAKVLMVSILVRVVFAYFTQHYVFRWRTAMNEYYMENWPKLRHVEGAAQRVQEDTMRFAGIMEGLGSAFVSSVMTLIAFLPLLWELSSNVTELPLVGAVNGSMVFVALLSAAFGTVLLSVVGIRLPGLEFHNQRVKLPTVRSWFTAKTIIHAVSLQLSQICLEKCVKTTSGCISTISISMSFASAICRVRI